MAFRIFLLCVMALSADGASDKVLKPVAEPKEEKDLKTASSSYSHQYSNLGGRYPSGYDVSVTGYGTIEDRSGAYYGDIVGSNNVGYKVSPGSRAGYDGYKGYDGIGQIGYERGIGGYGGNSGYGVSGGYGGNTGYGASGGYGGSTGYGASGGYGGSSSYGVNGGYGENSGYGLSGGYGNRGYGGGYPGNSAIGGNSVYYGGKSGYAGGVAGNGGYGGYEGNGGLSSYYGYNNPYYQGNNHLGYGYYKRPGSIYNNAITPSLVTGYRGYSR